MCTARWGAAEEESAERRDAGAIDPVGALISFQFNFFTTFLAIFSLF